MSQFGLRLKDECFPAEPNKAVINHAEKHASLWKCSGLSELEGPCIA